MIIATILAVVLSAAAPQASSGRTVVVEVEGLACPFCVYGLERQFGRLVGVEKADVDLGEGKAALKLEPGAKVTEAQIREAVRKAGFKASEIKGIGEGGGPEGESFTGRLERSGDRFTLVTEGGEKYLLFNEEGTDAAHALSEAARKRLEGLAGEKKRVTVRGQPHEHKGLPKGLKVESIEPAR